MPETKKPVPEWDVLTLGEVAGTFEERADGLFARDCGGDASNVAIAVARMGGQAAIAARLGRDDFAKEARALWQRAGVDARLVREDGGAPTGHRIALRSGKDMAARAGMAPTRVRPGDLPATEVAKARVLHLSGVALGLSASARKAAEIAAEQAQAAGALVSFDPVYQADLWAEDEAASPLLAMAARADVLFPSTADARRLFGSSDPATALDRMLGHGPQVVVLRTGEGAWVASRSGRSFVLSSGEAPLHRLAVRDSFIGTFLSGLTAGEDLVATTTRALQAAELAGAVPGEAASIPGLEDLLVYPETAMAPSAARVQPMRAGP